MSPYSEQVNNYLLQHIKSIFLADTRRKSNPRSAGYKKIIDKPLKVLNMAAWRLKALKAGIGMMYAHKKAAMLQMAARATDTPLRLSTSPTISWKEKKENKMNWRKKILLTEKWK